MHIRMLGSSFDDEKNLMAMTNELAGTELEYCHRQSREERSGEMSASIPQLPKLNHTCRTCLESKDDFDCADDDGSMTNKKLTTGFATKNQNKSQGVKMKLNQFAYSTKVRP